MTPMERAMRPVSVSGRSRALEALFHTEPLPVPPVVDGLSIREAVEALTRPDLPAHIAVALALDVLDPDGTERAHLEQERRAS